MSSIYKEDKMNKKEKLSMLEEMMDLESNTLKEDQLLDELEEWDSMTSLSFILLMDEQFNQIISGDEIKRLRTVSDMLSLMEHDE